MAISKKGSRKITVANTDYLYKVSKLKKKSDWREQQNELDETFMKYASYYGLGKVKDATINLVVQSADLPRSHLFVKFHTLQVAGFMGPEQILEIKPALVAKLIEKALKEGWRAKQKGDHRFTLAQKWQENKKPVILQLPQMNKEAGTYENLEKPIEIDLGE
ncbi:MAG: hypothetical protein R8P61_36905 [Bacteroidia bacterium]|nr:hypothetical protein [Bacteroidia bacterium]